MNRLNNNLDQLQNNIASQLSSNSGEPKCCFCFPMKCGIIMIGVFIAMDISQGFAMCNSLYQVDIVSFSIYAFAQVFLAYSCLQFLIYVFSDTYHTRKKLVDACTLMVFTNILEFLAILVGAIISPLIPFAVVLQQIPVNGISMLMYLYFRYICVWWMSMKSYEINSQGGRGGGGQ